MTLPSEQKKILAVAGGTMPALVYLHFLVTGLNRDIEKISQDVARLSDRIQRVEIRILTSQDCETGLGKKYPASLR